MKHSKIIALPDKLQHWQGTAAQLADQLNEVLVGEDAGAANERLVRYYVAEGVLTEPTTRGRERMFGFRQIIEFIAARQYLADGWPLAKVRELVRSDPGLQALMTSLPAVNEPPPELDAPTPAQQALHRLSESSLPSAKSGARTASDPFAFGPANAEAALVRAATMTGMRSQLQSSLQSLGNPKGRASRKRVLQLGLTPWCQVLIDADQLMNMDGNATRTLGEALTSALETERLAKGEKK